MRKIQAQGVHHITLNGADRQTSIDFWEGVLGMPFIFDQPNLDNPNEGHLYFDPGDGRLITIFTNEDYTPDPTGNPRDPGTVHHIAFNVSRATLTHSLERLDARGIEHTPIKDRGFMESVYFKDPLGLTIELACYKAEAPEGVGMGAVLAKAYELRMNRGAYAIEEEDVLAAIEALTPA